MMRSEVDEIDVETARERYGVSAERCGSWYVLDTYPILGYDIELSDIFLWPVGDYFKERGERWGVRMGNSKGPYTSGRKGDVWWRAEDINL